MVDRSATTLSIASTLRLADDKNENMTGAISERPKTSPQYPALDVIRFLACLLVVLNHLRGNQFLPFWDVQCSSPLLKRMFFMATRLGSESVVVFFVISGFLVGGIAIDRFLQGTFNSRKYFVDRLTRIYTPLLPAVLFSVVAAASVGMATTWMEVAGTLASLHVSFGNELAINLSLWSLAYEVWFYILCGGVLTLLQQQGSARTVLAFLAVVASAVVFAGLNTAYLFAWLFGVCAYFLKGKTRAWHMIVALPLVVAGTVGMQLTSISNQIDLKGFFSYTLYLIHTPLMIVLFRLEILRPFGELTLFTTAYFLMTTVAIGAAAWVMALPFEFQTDGVRRWFYK